MKFVPKTEKEISEANLWPKGNYLFEILEADDAISKTSENEMIKLKIKIFQEDGKSQVIFDYLLAAMDYKLRHICDACSLLSKYESGDIQAFDFVGKTGYCKVGVSIDKKGNFPDKNSISDYLTDKPDNAKSLGEVLENDETIPF